MSNLLDVELSGGAAMRCKHCNGEVLFIDSTHTATKCLDCSIENSHKNGDASMTTTRYFEVKVIKKIHSCKACPHSPIFNRLLTGCGKVAYNELSDVRPIDIYRQNYDQLTDSCPMWNETKESETK